MPSSVPGESLVGQVLSERYRILRRLGSGGFGTVYAALSLKLGTEVAVKVARTDRDEGRILREARAAACLKSPYAVRVFDVDRLETGKLYIAMEYLEGRPLKQYLREEGPIPLLTALAWFKHACAALREAHALNLVHRDIKPSNLYVVETPNLEPHLKLLDFGLAKTTGGPPVDDLTDSGAVVGTPQYMSPEQVRAVTVTHQSDLWSLGVVLYEMLSGRLPFERETSTATLVAIASEPATPLAEVAPGVPEAIAAVVSRCLRRAPKERFQSVEELVTALDAIPISSRSSVSAVPPRPSERGGVESASGSTLGTFGTELTKTRVGSPFAAVALVGVGVIVGASYWLSRGQLVLPDPGTAPAASPIVVPQRPVALPAPLVVPIPSASTAPELPTAPVLSAVQLSPPRMPKNHATKSAEPPPSASAFVGEAEFGGRE